MLLVYETINSNLFLVLLKAIQCVNLVINQSKETVMNPLILL